MAKRTAVGGTDDFRGDLAPKSLEHYKEHLGEQYGLEF
jgi:hypothetical protein